MADLSSLLKDAFTIYSEAYLKIADLGVEVVDLEGDRKQPKKISQLIEATSLYGVISPSIILNDAGTAIAGVIGDIDTINNLLLKLKKAVGIYSVPAFPTPLTTFSFSFGGDGGFNFGAGQLGDLITNDGTDWVRLGKGADGTVLVSTPSGVQWQSVVGNGIPSGGSGGQYLKKNTSSNYDVVWDTITVTDITDITASTAELNILDGVVGVDHTKINYLSDVTGPIQAQFIGKLSTSLANGSFLVGNGSSIATPVAPTGDVTFSNTGVFAISADSIVNADINSAAGITRSKLATGTANRLVINNASGAMTDASSITPNRVLVSDSSGIPTHTLVSNTTIAFMDATSSVQTQINSKLTASITSVAQGNMLYYNGTSWINFAIGSAGQVLTSNGTIPSWGSSTANGLPTGGTANQYLKKTDGGDYNTTWDTLTIADVTDVTATAAEINILHGVTGVSASEISFVGNVTSDIQGQIDSKMSNSLSHHSIWVGGVGDTAQQVGAGSENSVLTIISGHPVWQSPPAPGNVSGGGSSTDNAVVRWNLATGTVIQNSGVIIDDSNNTSGMANLMLTTGSALRTAQSAGNTLLLQAYDVDGTAYTTFATLTANNTPTMDLATSVTQGGAVIYRVGGTDVALGDGGTGASLSDPGGHRLWGWDDTDNAISFITIGSGLTYDHATHTLTASGGGGGTITGPGSSTDNAIVRWDSVTGTVIQNSVVTVSDTGALAGVTSVTLDTAGSLRTSTSAGNTVILQAYDVDSAIYVTFATLTANNTPTMDLNGAVTIGTAYPYRVAGNDVALLDGGTGASLSDPNADRIFFWDDSANSTAWLAPDSTLLITTTNIGLNTNGVGDTHLRQSAALSVIGRSANSTGNVADISSTADGQFLKRVSGALGWSTILIDDLPGETIENVTGTTYTFVEADKNKIKRVTNASGCTMNLPNGLSTGWIATVYRGLGAGLVTLTASTTLESAGTTIETEATVASVFHRGSNIFAAVGALGTSGGTISGLTINRIPVAGSSTTLIDYPELVWDSVNSNLYVSNRIGAGTVTPDRTIHGEVNDASNTSVTYAARFTHTTSGTSTAGIGVGIEFEVETATGNNNEVGGVIEVVATDITAASEDFDMVFKVMTAGIGTFEMMRIKSTGAVEMPQEARIGRQGSNPGLIVGYDFVGANIGGTTNPRMLQVSTNTVNSGMSYAARFTTWVSNAPGTGVGVGIEFEAETAANNFEIGAIIEAITTDVTGASEDFDIVFKAMSGGTSAAEKFRIKSTGVLQGVFTQDDALTRVLVSDTSGNIYWRSSTTIGGGGGGITNTAISNELMKSDGTNAIPSGFFSTVAGDISLGGSATAFGSRTISAGGSGTNVDIIIQSKGTGGIYLVAGSTGIFATTILTTFRYDVGSNSTTNYVVNFESGSGSVPATGIGTGIRFVTKTAVGNTEIGSSIESVTTDVTAASEDFDIVFKNMSAGATAVERFRISSTGLLKGVFTQDDALTRVLVSNTSGELYWRSSATLGGAGITNTAGANEIMKSDGTNAVVSGIFSTTSGHIILGDSAGGGTSRSISVAGSSANIDLNLQPKGSGNLNLTAGGSVSMLSADGLKYFAASNSGIGSITDGFTEIKKQNSLTNTIGKVIQFSHTTSGTPATGIGMSLEFVQQTSSSNSEIGAVIEVVTTDVTSTSEDFDIIFKSMAAGATAAQRLRLKSTGVIQATFTQDDALTRVVVSDSSGNLYWRDVTTIGGGGGGITNSAAANEIMKSNGANAVPSGIFSTTAGDATFGTSLSGSTRTLDATGSATDVGFTFTTKGTGTSSDLIFKTGGNEKLRVNNSLVTSSAAFAVTVDDATTNAVTYIVDLTHTSSGTPANNIGVGMRFIVETAAANNEIGGIIEAVATDTTSTSEDFEIVFKGMTAGAAATERFRLGTTFATFGTDYQLRLMSGTVNAGLNVGSVATSPTTPNDADIWYNSTTGNFFLRKNAGTHGTMTSLTIGTNVNRIPYQVSGAPMTYSNEAGFEYNPSTNTFISDNMTSNGIITAVQPTLGSAVLIVKSTATNDDPTVTTYQNRVTTSNATITTLHTFAVPSSTTVTLIAYIVARRTGGASGTAEDGASYIIAATFKNVAGTATIIGSTSILHSSESQAGFDAVFTASSGNVLVQVTGATSNDITWHLAKLEALPVST